MNQRTRSSTTEPKESQVRSPAYQLTMLSLSVYVLVALSLESLVVQDPEIKTVLQLIDLLICGIFFVDFLILFITAKNKFEFMRWGWIDLISSIPMVDPFRWGRLARIVRIIRILRIFKSFRVIYQSVRASPFETLSLMTFLIVFFSFTIASGLILEFEREFDSSIRQASDAIWWSFLSILNAKGASIPVSPEGVLATVFLNKIGLLLFAYINASIISWLINSKPSSEHKPAQKGVD